VIDKAMVDTVKNLVKLLSRRAAMSAQVVMIDQEIAGMFGQLGRQWRETLTAAAEKDKAALTAARDKARSDYLAAEAKITAEVQD
jgi:hypothetical protein